MFSQTVLVAVLAATIEAKFGNEQIPIPAIAAVTSGGEPGQAATLAGETVSTLLGGANPCDKLAQADKIIETLGTGDDAMAAAIGLVAAEQNTNPFVVDRPSICNDPALPATPELRGILPLVDEAVDGADVANQISAQSVDTPFDAEGLSVAEIMAANGFDNLTPVDSDGAEAAVDVAGAEVDDAANDADNVEGDNAANNVEEDNAANNAAATTLATQVAAATGAAGNAQEGCAVAPAAGNEHANNAANNKNQNENQNQNDNNNQQQQQEQQHGEQQQGEQQQGEQQQGEQQQQEQQQQEQQNNNEEDAAAEDVEVEQNEAAQGGNAGGADFGSCVPTMEFTSGFEGRDPDEFAFQSLDPAIAANQQEALNPEIIENRICDELVNICEANDAAIALCEDAQAAIGQGNRDAQVAEDWNAFLGF